MTDKLPMPIGDALRLLRTRIGLTQTAAARRPGAPDFRTLSHWETARKNPSFVKLHSYLEALGLDLRNLQEALDQIVGRPTPRVEDLATRIENLEHRVTELETHK